MDQFKDFSGVAVMRGVTGVRDHGQIRVGEMRGEGGGVKTSPSVIVLFIACHPCLFCNNAVGRTGLPSKRAAAAGWT